MQPEIILTEIDVPGAKLTKDLAECNVDELKSWLVQTKRTIQSCYAGFYSIAGDGWRDFPSRNLPQNFSYGYI